MQCVTRLSYRPDYRIVWTIVCSKALRFKLPGALLWLLARGKKSSHQREAGSPEAASRSAKPQGLSRSYPDHRPPEEACPLWAHRSSRVAET